MDWVEWVSNDSTPCLLRLDFGPDERGLGNPESIWFAAGPWERDRFAIATDDVTVIFERTEAARTRMITAV